MKSDNLQEEFAGVVARASCRACRDIEALRARMSGAERQVEGLKPSRRFFHPTRLIHTHLRDVVFAGVVARILQKPINFAAFLETVREFLAREIRADDSPLDETAYYHEYRRLLEAKLSQKARQIARDEQLLSEQADAGGRNLQDSLRQAIRERDELNLLLEEIQKQLERIDRAG